MVFLPYVLMAMELHQFVVLAVSFLGFITLFKPILSFFRWVWVTFFRPAKNLKEYGSWAIVTGSTDGIGKAFAFELASKGLNLVLVGRNPAKLELTSKEIRGRHEIDIRTLVIDLAKFSGQEISKAIEDGIEGLDVGILINNAGVGYPYAKFFHEIDSELMMSIMKVNIDGLTWVTRSVLPVMLKKKKGAIVNIGSGSSVVVPSYPLFSVYAATKAYVAMFSRSIHLEYKQKGIDVQCQVPLFVATKMVKFKRSSFFIPSAEMYSKAGIRWIGYDHLCLPYWTHSLQWFIFRSFPDALVTRYVFHHFLGDHKIGLDNESIRSAKLN